jgi:hypothetical protein
MELNEERIRELVTEEARRIQLSWTAVDPLVTVIKYQWITHGNFDWFDVSTQRKRLIYDPSLTTQCLLACIRIINNNFNDYFKKEGMVNDKVLP